MVTYKYKKCGEPLDRGGINYISKVVDAHIFEKHNDEETRWEYTLDCRRRLNAQGRECLKDHGLVPLVS